MVRNIVRWTTMALTAVACAFAPPSDAQGPRDAKKKNFASRANPAQEPENTLGNLVRSYANDHRVNLALMNGLEVVPAGPLDKIRRNDSKEAFEKAIMEANAVLHDSGEFTFIIPQSPVYGPLTRYSLTGRVDPSYVDVKTTLQIGSGTPIYNALALLGYVLDRTIIADNTISDQPTGEIAVFDVPLTATVETILKSARVPGEAIAIASTSEFILVHSPATNPKVRETANVPEYLARRVSVTLPNPALTQGQFPASEVMPLHAVLTSLSRQLDVPVTVQPTLRSLPVTPVHMSRVTIATALDLLLAQWPVSDIAIDAEPDRIVIRSAQ